MKAVKFFVSIMVPCTALFLTACNPDSGNTNVANKGAAVVPTPLKLTVISETPTYQGYDFKNALDGNPDDNYVAGLENERQAIVELGMEHPASPTALHLTWNDPSQFAGKVQVYGRAEKGEKEALIAEAHVTSEPTTHIPLKTASDIQSVRIVFSEFAGQPRILLKLLELF